MHRSIDLEELIKNAEAVYEFYERIRAIGPKFSENAINLVTLNGPDKMYPLTARERALVNAATDIINRLFESGPTIN